MKTTQKILTSLLPFLLATFILFTGCKQKQFNPETSVGKGWTTLEDNPASLKIDPLKSQLVTTLRTGEKSISGEDNRKRLKEIGYILFGAKEFQSFWENQSQIQPSWKEKINGKIQYIVFSGTVLQSPVEYRCVVCLYWGHDSQWHWLNNWLGSNFDANYLSAVQDK